MIPYKWPVQASVPQTLAKRLEIAQAVRAIVAPEEDDGLRHRRAEIAGIRRDLNALALATHELQRACDRRLRSYVLKAAPDDPEHPGWPAGAPDGRGGKFRPKDDDAMASDVGADTGGAHQTANDESGASSSISSSVVTSDYFLASGEHPAAPGFGSTAGASQGTSLNPMAPDASIPSRGGMAGQVIHVCVAYPDPTTPPNTCRYWCQNGGYVLDRQRNLGFACPSIIVAPQS